MLHTRKKCYVLMFILCVCVYVCVGVCVGGQTMVVFDHRQLWMLMGFRRPGADLQPQVF